MSEVERALARLLRALDACRKPAPNPLRGDPGNDALGAEAELDATIDAARKALVR